MGQHIECRVPSTEYRVPVYARRLVSDSLFTELRTSCMTVSCQPVRKLLHVAPRAELLARGMR